MAEKNVVITNETGLHARPASEFVKLASGCACDVFLAKEGKKVNAKSILGLLSLGITKGTELSVITEGEGEGEALDKLVGFLESIVD